MLRADAALHVDLTTKQSLQAGLRIGNADDFHLGNAGRTLEIVHVRHKPRRALGVEIHQSERPGANPRRGDGVTRSFGDHAQTIVHQQQGKVCKRGAERQFDRGCVNRFDTIDHRNRSTGRAIICRVQNALQRINHILCPEAGAVVEHHTIAQRKGPFRRIGIGRPRGCQIRRWAAIHVRPHQAAHDLFSDLEHTPL